MSAVVVDDGDNQPTYRDPDLPASASYFDGLPEIYGEGRTIGVFVPSDIAITPQQAREFACALLELADYADRQDGKVS